MKLSKIAAEWPGETARAENGPSIEGITCAFVRTVRGFLESKCSIDRGLAVRKCRYEIAEMGRTVRAGPEMCWDAGEVPSAIRLEEGGDELPSGMSAHLA